MTRTPGSADLMAAPIPEMSPPPQALGLGGLLAHNAHLNAVAADRGDFDR